MGYTLLLKVYRKRYRKGEKVYEYYYLELPRNFIDAFGFKPSKAKLVVNGVEAWLPVVCFNKSVRVRRRSGDVTIEYSKKKDVVVCRIPLQSDLYYSMGEPKKVKVEVVK